VSCTHTSIASDLRVYPILRVDKMLITGSTPIVCVINRVCLLRKYSKLIDDSFAGFSHVDIMEILVAREQGAGG